MAGKGDPLKDTIDRLYGLPLDEFTPARDAAAKERRAEKDREGADALKRLRKPNLVAWSLNRVRRAQADAVEELIAAGERLQEAQRQLVSRGERGLLRDAAADERRLVGHVADLASAELGAAGHAPDAGMQSKLFATLHAAAANVEVRGLLAAGRLVRDHELSDLGLGDGDGTLAAAPPRPRGGDRQPRRLQPRRLQPRRRSHRPPAAHTSARSVRSPTGSSALALTTPSGCKRSVTRVRAPTRPSAPPTRRPPSCGAPRRRRSGPPPRRRRPRRPRRRRTPQPSERPGRRTKLPRRWARSRET